MRCTLHHSMYVRDWAKACVIQEPPRFWMAIRSLSHPKGSDQFALFIRYPFWYAVYIRFPNWSDKVRWKSQHTINFSFFLHHPVYGEEQQLQYFKRQENSNHDSHFILRKHSGCMSPPRDGTPPSTFIIQADTNANHSSAFPSRYCL